MLLIKVKLQILLHICFVLCLTSLHSCFILAWFYSLCTFFLSPFVFADCVCRINAIKMWRKLYVHFNKSNICFIPPVVLYRSLWPRHEICTKCIKFSALSKVKCRKHWETFKAVSFFFFSSSFSCFSMQEITRYVEMYMSHNHRTLNRIVK